MQTFRWVKVLSLPFLVTLFAPHTAQAVDTTGVCDRAYAKATLKSGAYAEFCGCKKVSNLFLRAIQSSDVFQDVLVETSGLCAPLASLLTDPATASLQPDLYRPEREERSNGDSARNRNTRARSSSERTEPESAARSSATTSGNVAPSARSAPSNVASSVSNPAPSASSVPSSAAPSVSSTPSSATSSVSSALSSASVGGDDEVYNGW